MSKMLVLGSSARGCSYLVTPLACAFVIHNTSSALPDCYKLIHKSTSWTKANKGKISKQQRRK